MKKHLFVPTLCACVLALVAVQAYSDISIPDGTLSASGEGGYDHVISDNSINAQDYPEAHVTGTVTGFNFVSNNAGWFEIGLITKSERDRATTYGVHSYMFNQSVFMMAMQGSNVAMPSDYAGDFPGGTGEAQNIPGSFDFDLKLVPNMGGTGGTAYLSIGTGDYGSGLTYGTDNWNNYGWSFPDEDLSEAYLIVQLYTWDSSTEGYSVSFENVKASVIPLPGSVLLCGIGVGFIGIVRRIRRKS